MGRDFEKGGSVLLEDTRPTDLLHGKRYQCRQIRRLRCTMATCTRKDGAMIHKTTYKPSVCVLFSTSKEQSWPEIALDQLLMLFIQSTQQKVTQYGALTNTVISFQSLESCPFIKANKTNSFWHTKRSFKISHSDVGRTVVTSQILSLLTSSRTVAVAGPAQGVSHDTA